MSERRRAPRCCDHELTCSRGRVIDASTRGMRLVTRQRWLEGETRSLTIRTGDALAVVRAEAVWSRRDGFMQHTVGLAFVELGADAMSVLAAALPEDAGPRAVVVPREALGSAASEMASLETADPRRAA